jgi:hypothetical protein
MSSAELFNELNSYNWDADQEFQVGLKGILDSNSAQTDDQKSDLILRARCFYFARWIYPLGYILHQLQQRNWDGWCRKFGKQVDFEDYKAARAAKSRASTATSSISLEDQNRAEASSSQIGNDDPPSIPYAELVEMIQTGKPVPGIKDIPDTVLSGQGTQSVAAKRRKPWEKDVEDSSGVSIPAAAATASVAQTQQVGMS